MCAGNGCEESPGYGSVKASHSDFGLETASSYLEDLQKTCFILVWSLEVLMESIYSSLFVTRGLRCSCVSEGRWVKVSSLPYWDVLLVLVALCFSLYSLYFCPICLVSFALSVVHHLLV